MTKINPNYNLSASELKLATAMAEVGHQQMEVVRAITWMQLVPRALTDAGLVGFNIHGEPSPSIGDYQWRLTDQGPMLTFPVPAGATIESFEEKIELLQTVFDHCLIEVQGYAGTPLPVNLLFVLRDRTMRNDVLSVQTLDPGNFTRGESVILNPGRSVQLRICGTANLSTEAIVDELLTNLQLDERHWEISVIDLTSSWLRVLRHRSSGGVALIGDLQSAEDVIDNFIHEMFDRLKLVDQHSGAIPEHLRRRPCLLLINDYEALLNLAGGNRIEAQLDETRAKNFEQRIFNLGRSEHLAMHVILGSPSSQMRELDISVQEALLVLGVDSVTSSASESAWGY